MARVQTDPEMLKLLIALEAALNAGLSDVADEIQKIIEDKGKTDSAGALSASLTALTAYFVSMVNETRNTQMAIAESQVKKNLRRDLVLLKKAGAPAAYIQEFKNKLEDYPNRVGKAFFTKPHPADRVAYLPRIKTVRTGAERTIRNVIRNSNKKGESAQDMALRVRSYLKPGVTGKKVEPLKEARIAAGINKPYKPKGVRSGSIPYQAMRIARSESAETYRAAHSDMYEGTVLDGGDYDWLLSNSHSGPDRCDDLAKKSPYKAKKRPNSHPNCICTWSKRPFTVEEVRKRLQAAGIVD